MIDEMQKFSRRSTFWMILLSLAATAPGLFLSLEDSEIWGITSSRRFLDEIGSVSSAHIKPLFSLFFGTLVKLAPTDWDALYYSRLLTVGLAGIGIFFLFRLIASTYHSFPHKVAAFTLAGLTMSMPVFLLHFGKARSDTVAVSLALWAITLINKSLNKRLIFHLASTSVLLITPKSLDLVVVFACFAWMDRSSGNSNTTNWESRLKQFAWLVSPAAVLFAVAFVFGREPLVKALTYWLDSYRENPITTAEHWLHLKMTIQSAWIPSILLAVGILASLYTLSSPARRSQLSPTELAFIRSGLIVVAFLLLHSQKYQFFLASRLPFILMLATPGWVQLLRSATQNIVKTRVLLVAIAVVSTNFALSTNRIHREQLFALDLQKSVHSNLLAYLQKSQISSYWDAIGLFPKQNRIFHYPSPGDRSNEDMPAFIESSRPLLVIRTPKMNLLEPYLFVWLQKKYAPVSEDIHTRVAHLFEQKNNPKCELTTDELLLRAKEEGLRDRDLILLVKTKANNIWNQVPFRIVEGAELATVDSSLSRESLVFKGCHDAGTHYALSEAGPWTARPITYDSTLFGYDGRL